MRAIGIVTGARSDWGIYLPILRMIQQDTGLRLHLIVTGMHLSPEFGRTVRVVEEDGFEVAEQIEMLLSSDTPGGLVTSMGVGLIGFAQAYSRKLPDILLVLGDRVEMLAAATAALPFKLPVAHIHGGESTEGLIDEAIRHAITKMSHLHFVSTDVYARRVIQMGEEPWRVVVSGAPSLDNLRTLRLLNAGELASAYGVPVNRPFLLVTYHPVTLEYDQTESQVREVLAALDKVDLDLVFTYPNADTSGRLILEMIQSFAAERPGTHVLVNVGTAAYFGLMSAAAAMVGNSSSGLIEAPSFRLPVVDIGNRQRGRIRATNVIGCRPERGEIVEAIRQATSAEFRASLADLVNPYGDGRAAERIVRTLKETALDERLLLKRFYEVRSGDSCASSS